MSELVAGVHLVVTLLQIDSGQQKRIPTCGLQVKNSKHKAAMIGATVPTDAYLLSLKKSTSKRRSGLCERVKVMYV